MLEFPLGWLKSRLIGTTDKSREPEGSEATGVAARQYFNRISVHRRGLAVAWQGHSGDDGPLGLLFLRADVKLSMYVLGINARVFPVLIHSCSNRVGRISRS